MPERDETKNDNDVLAGLRINPAGKPAEKSRKSILVHRCLAKASTDYRCDCNERITQTEANTLLQNGKAEWLRTERNGKPYVRRKSIVILQTSDEAIQVAAERQAAYAAELEARAAERKAADKRQAIGKVVSAFRKKLTLEENQRWPEDADVIRAFETIKEDGSAIKNQMLETSNKEVAEERDYFKEMATTARLYAALFEGAVKYWDVLLIFEGLPRIGGSICQTLQKEKGCW